MSAVRPEAEAACGAGTAGSGFEAGAAAVVADASASAGTSMVALSDSSVTRPWSFYTVSPTATRISITGTSLWPPMSGTLLSMSAMTGSLQHGPTHVGQQ